MSTRVLIPSVLLSAGLLAVASVSQAAPAIDSQPCFFEKYPPTSASQYSVDPESDYASYAELKGAALYIPAREGLTKEWLELSVQRALAQQPVSKSSDLACNPPDTQNLRVHVISAGNGFWVTLISEDEKSANDILVWASRVVRQQQLAQIHTKR